MTDRLKLAKRLMEARDAINPQTPCCSRWAKSLCDDLLAAAELLERRCGTCKWAHEVTWEDEGRTFLRCGQEYDEVQDNDLPCRAWSPKEAEHE